MHRASGAKSTRPGMWQAGDIDPNPQGADDSGLNCRVLYFRKATLGSL